MLAEGLTGPRHHIPHFLEAGLSKDALKVVIPMAGLGTRLRPQTWSKPKQLVTVAGKAVLGHVLDLLKTLPDPDNIELINIVGYLGEQIEAYMQENYPNLEAHYVTQEDPHGQSHAISLARDYLEGPMLIIFPDTLIETDFSFLVNESSDVIIWVKAVEDPRPFAVAELGQDGLVTQLIEKPQNPTSNLAVVGFYYVKDASALVRAVDVQMSRNIQFRGEFFLADALNIMIEQGAKTRVCQVDTWLDAGTPAALLETNRYLLDHGSENTAETPGRPQVVIIPPVFIHPSAIVEFSIIGPHVSLGANCQVRTSIVRDSILEDAAQVTGVILESSLIGRKAMIRRKAGVINAGDQTEVIL